MASKSEWNNFFLDAKIPKDVAARYAVNFYKNRMSFEMLADLNKDYLRDLDITVLGDVISILKHAKDVQNKQESDVFMVSGRKKSNSPAPPAPATQRSISTVTNSDIPKKTDKKNEFSSRLGPPQALKFPTPVSAVARTSQNWSFPCSIPLQASTKSTATSQNVQESAKNSTIFARLDKSPNSNDSSQPLTKLKVTLDDNMTRTFEHPRRSVNTLLDSTDHLERPRNLLKRPASSSVTLGDSTIQGKRESDQKKKYFVWKTYSDGTQVKEYLDEEQIKAYKLNRTMESKKMKFPDNQEEISVRNMLYRKNISPSPRPRELPRSSREPDVRNRIGTKPTTSSTNFSRVNLNADRNSEQQKSVKSRLSLPSSSGSLRTTKSSMSIETAVPKARNRITAPLASDTRVHRIAINDRLGGSAGSASKVPKARKRITGPESPERNEDTMSRSLNKSLNDRIGGKKFIAREIKY